MKQSVIWNANDTTIQSEYLKRDNEKQYREHKGATCNHLFFFPFSRTLQTCHDDASKFVHLLAKPGCNYLEQDDFIPFLQVLAAALTGRGAGLGWAHGKITRIQPGFWRGLWLWGFMWQKTKLIMYWRDVQKRGLTRIRLD